MLAIPEVLIASRLGTAVGGYLSTPLQNLHRVSGALAGEVANGKSKPGTN